MQFCLSKLQAATVKTLLYQQVEGAAIVAIALTQNPYTVKI